MTPRIRMALGVAALFAGAPPFAAADIIGYRGQKDLHAEGETV